MFAYWILKTAQFAFCLLPPGLSRCLGRMSGRLAYLLDRRHRRIALKNLKMVFGGEKSLRERKRIARNSFSWLGFNLIEFLRVPRFARPGWEKNFRVSGREVVQRALSRSRGIIFVLAHFGNWEYLGFAPRLLGFRGAAVGQDIKNPAVDGLVKDTREKIGLELFSKFEVASSILNFLAANGCIAILADQRTRKMEVTVDFLGQPARTTAAPAILAVKSKAALVPVFIYYREGYYRIVFDEEVKVPEGLPVRETVRETTRKIAAVFEARVRETPSLWLWAHRRWRKWER